MTNTVILENQIYALLKDIENGMSLQDLILNHPSLFFNLVCLFKE